MNSLLICMGYLGLIKVVNSGCEFVKLHVSDTYLIKAAMRFFFFSAAVSLANMLTLPI